MIGEPGEALQVRATHFAARVKLLLVVHLDTKGLQALDEELVLFGGTKQAGSFNEGLPGEGSEVAALGGHSEDHSLKQ